MRLRMGRTRTIAVGALLALLSSVLIGLVGAQPAFAATCGDVRATVNGVDVKSNGCQ